MRTPNQLPSRGLALALAGAALLAFSPVASADFESNLDKTFPVSPGGKLVVEADRGDITATTGDAANVTIKVWRKVKGGAQEKADRLFADHEVTFTQDGNTVRVTAKAKSDKAIRISWREPQLQVKYEVAIPRRFDANLKTAAGNVQLGPVLEGDAVAQTSAGNITLKTVTGTVEARTSGGNIRIDDAGKTVTAHTSAGNIHVGKAAAKVDAHTSGGDVVVEAAADAVVAGTSAGNIRVKQAAGKVEAKTAGGNIEVGAADAAVTVQTSAGNIKLGAMKAKVEARNTGGDITVSQAHAAVTAKTSAGNVSATFAAAPDGDVQLETSGGNVTLALPESAAVNLSAKTAAGNVTSELPVTTVATTSRKSGQLSGQINGGGPVMTLRTSAGNIRVKKLPATGQ